MFNNAELSNDDITQAGVKALMCLQVSGVSIWKYKGCPPRVLIIYYGGCLVPYIPCVSTDTVMERCQPRSRGLGMGDHWGSHGPHHD